MSRALFERAAAGSHSADSAGTRPADRVHPEVIHVMDELGIDLTGPGRGGSPVRRRSAPTWS